MRLLSFGPAGSYGRIPMPSPQQQAALNAVHDVDQRHLAANAQIVEQGKSSFWLSEAAIGAAGLSGKLKSGIPSAVVVLKRAEVDITQASRHRFKANLDHWVVDLRAIPGVTVHPGVRR